MRNWILSLAVLALLVAPASAAPQSYAPHFGDLFAQCALSSDKSSMTVVASNSGDTAFHCSAYCRANMTGAMGFDRLNCNFDLAKGAKGAKARTVCDKDGGKPNFYSQVGPTKYSCVPR